MAELKEIRAALAAAINEAIPDVQCSGYVLAQPTAPFFDIELAQPTAIEYDKAMGRGLDLWRFTVRGCASYNLDEQAQMQLDEWCASSGESSVKEALEADRTLGGIAENLHVVSVSGFTPVASIKAAAQPSNTYLAVEWTVEVYARGA